MTKFVDKGGIFDSSSLTKHNPLRTSLISLNRFEDGQLYIQDGHHRIVGIYLDHRDFLYPSEYFIEYWSYDDYLELNESSLKRDWLTPFDPRTEIRNPEFHSYKKLVPENGTLEFIKRAWKDGVYCQSRDKTKIWTLKDLVNQVKDKI
jgi:hypothetical protein